ncbi:MAG: RpiB/LacA/LacB family sugar-phosphate isomerase [Anaerolineales bacterium]|nr:RpiB/LacA/LacB family sugar-phosphate isomerase [Anaerolineales bacterium]
MGLRLICWKQAYPMKTLSWPSTRRKCDSTQNSPLHNLPSYSLFLPHDDMNVLCLGARIIGPEVAKELVAAFLSARFTAEERHLRRTGKVREMEKGS